MSLAANFVANPIIQRLRAKQDFVAIATIRLRRWEQLDAASWWCECRWRNHDRQYRRLVRVANCLADFQFPREDDAIEFLMMFG
jgi:hypothetical protein